MEVNRAVRSLYVTALKQVGDGLTIEQKASLFASCQQNAMGLWSMTRPLRPCPGGVPLDGPACCQKVEGPKILETEEPAKAA